MDFTEARDSLLQAGCPSCRPTNSIKALKALTATHTHTETNSIVTGGLRLLELYAVKNQRNHKSTTTIKQQQQTTMLCQPLTTTTFAKRAFQCSAPAVWNSLLKTVLSSDSVAVFKLRLKTFLFSQAFSSFSAH